MTTKSDKEIYADVYIAAMNAYITTAAGRKDLTMPHARGSAEKTLNHFRSLVALYPECNPPAPHAVVPDPTILSTNPEAGKF